MEHQSNSAEVALSRLLVAALLGLGGFATVPAEHAGSAGERDDERRAAGGLEVAEPSRVATAGPEVTRAGPERSEPAMNLLDPRVERRARAGAFDVSERALIAVERFARSGRIGPSSRSAFERRGRVVDPCLPRGLAGRADPRPQPNRQ